MGSPFPPVFSYSRKYHKSFCGRIKRVTTVYTYCSILGSFLISQHLHQLMDSGCENWLRSGNRVRDCDFPSQWLTSASYSLVLVVCCCITNDHKLRSLKQNVFYYLTFFMGQKFRHILVESSTWGFTRLWSRCQMDYVSFWNSFLDGAPFWSLEYSSKLTWLLVKFSSLQL